MADATSGTSPGNGSGGSGGAIAGRPPFPVTRLLYAIGYGFLAWFVVHIIFVLAVVQFVMLALNGRCNEELKRFSLTLVQYLWEMMAFITFVRDEQPFPVGPFPKRA